MKFTRFVRISITVAAASGAAAHSPPSFRGIGVPDGFEDLVVTSLSRNGAVVAGSASHDGGAVFFLWDHVNGFFRMPIADPSGFEVQRVSALSEDGSFVVGAMFAPGLPGSQAFRYSRDGGYELLPAASAGGVSLDGRTVLVNTDDSRSCYLLVGNAAPIRIDPPAGHQFAYGRGVSGDGQVVFGGGTEFFEPVEAGFVWTSETGSKPLGDLPRGGVGTVPKASNVSGSIIVGYASSADPKGDARTEAFVWTADAGMRGLGDLDGGGFYSVALAVSEHGEVYGHGQGGDGRVAFVWDGKRGMRRVQEVLATEFGLEKDLHGWVLTSVVGVSADGRALAGIGRNPDGQIESWIATLGTPCRADWNADGDLTSADFFAFLDAFFCDGKGCPSADFNADGVENSQDFFDFLVAFFGGCE